MIAHLLFFLEIDNLTALFSTSPPPPSIQKLRIAFAKQTIIM